MEMKRVDDGQSDLLPLLLVVCLIILLLALALIYIPRLI